MAPEAGRDEIVCMIRYSTLFWKYHAFRNKTDSFRERSAKLFDPDRLTTRAAIFEAITIPSLLAQTDADFRILVMTSTILPDDHAARLAVALAPFGDRAAIVAMEPTEDFFAAQEGAVLSLSRPDKERITTFRLDDDDAIASDLVARMRAQVQNDDDGAEVISFPRGYYLRPEGGAVRVKPAKRKYIGCGLARVAWRGDFETIHSLRGAHHEIAEVWRTRIVRDGMAWAVTAHGLTDTNRYQARFWADQPPLAPEDATAALGPKFAALDLAKFAASSALAPYEPQA